MGFSALRPHAVDASRAPWTFRQARSTLNARNNSTPLIGGVRLELADAQAAIKREREILVEEDLHAAFTAGGWCAATCAA
jgi:hypothetical protein